MYFMTSRQDILEEQLLRENIRKAITIVKEKHDKQEQYVRTIVSTLLKEATVQKYEYTSLNLLAHFIKEVVGDPSRPDSSPAFKDAYTDLTSSHEDRELFVEYVLDFANEDFKTIDADKEPQSLGQSFIDNGFQDEEEEAEDEPEEDEVITVSVGDLEDNDGDLSFEPEEEEEEEEIFTLGEDAEEVEIEEENTGIRKYSREAYKRIGPPLRRYYGQVQKDSRLKKPVAIGGKEYGPDELSERDLFRIYLKKNLILWSERYEDEYFDKAPDVDVDIQSGAEMESEEETGGFEL
jgi:hypothetical protein